MGKLLLVIVVLGALGAAAYLGYQRFLAPPGGRACARVAERCGLAEEQVRACERVVDEVRERGGAEAATRLVTCLGEAVSCSQAAGCAAGSGLGVLSRSLLELVEGLRRAH
jgi:hypothetical protein